ncbi:hypothetical protein BKA62DRAFT_34020 [Auriculariales sp. MPI-PUGE-AT-0066]|nr:hypothetical protein BKA62DRAFT_34020 [Auriculariales sp. MPI-PUGE-AT-0066]
MMNIGSVCVWVFELDHERGKADLNQQADRQQAKRRTGRGGDVVIKEPKITGRQRRQTGSGEGISQMLDFGTRRVYGNGGRFFFRAKRKKMLRATKRRRRLRARLGRRSVYAREGARQKVGRERGQAARHGWQENELWPVDVSRVGSTVRDARARCARAGDQKETCVRAGECVRGVSVCDAFGERGEERDTVLVFFNTVMQGEHGSQGNAGGDAREKLLRAAVIPGRQTRRGDGSVCRDTENRVWAGRIVWIV